MSISSPAYSLTSFAPWGRRLHLESRWSHRRHSCEQTT